MYKSNKFIIPLALAKIVLILLVLQIFFSSCENDDLLYKSDVYTEGPVFEIQATLGNEVTQFVSGSDANVIKLGDTIYLEIDVDDNILYDELSTSNITLSKPEYQAQFSILDEEGNAAFPELIEVLGSVDSITSKFYDVTFGYSSSSDEPINNSLQHSSQSLKIGFVFREAGAYTFHFVNTPSNITPSGTVDIYYNRNAEDVMKAYAIYLFDLDGHTYDYGMNDESYKNSILTLAWANQAIIDFTIYKNN